ncbi:GNAT family N-acetyltransferase [Kitasatospora sp. NPDC051914]|uniref:GNAT family N-acetyltransferase n=1 Tax=Kitasatospora sp. NPDC051914 TaxID=3154945 RepID=UPI00341BF4A6
MEPLDVPELATDGGLTLRPWCLADLDLVREASQDDYIPLITTVPTQYSEAEGVAFIERQWGRAATGAGYPFVIVGEDGKPVGAVGLWLRSIGEGRASLGYWVVESGRGRRAAEAGLSAVVRWAVAALGIPRLELYVEPWNAASLKTAERVGFRREGLLRSWQPVGDERRDMFMYSFLRDDG